MHDVAHRRIHSRSRAPHTALARARDAVARAMDVDVCTGAATSIDDDTVGGGDDERVDAVERPRWTI